MTSQNGPVSVSSEASQIDSLKAKIAEQRKIVDQYGPVLEATAEDSPAYPLLKAPFDAATAEIDRLSQRLTGLEVSSRTRAVEQPVLTAIGAIKATDASQAPGNVRPADIASTIERMKADAALINTRVKVLEHTQSAITKAKVAPEVLGDLRPLSFVFDAEKGELRATFASGSSSAGRKGGTRTANGLKVIKAANDASIVGRKVGKDGDYASADALIKAVDPALWAKMPQHDEASTSKSRSSGAPELKKLGIVLEAIEAAPASDEAAESTEQAAE